MSDTQPAKALDIEEGDEKHAEAGGRDTKKEMWAQPSGSLKGHMGLCCDTCTSKCMQDSTSKEACFGFEGIQGLALSPAKIDKVDLAKYEFR